MGIPAALHPSLLKRYAEAGYQGARFRKGVWRRVFPSCNNKQYASSGH